VGIVGGNPKDGNSGRGFTGKDGNRVREFKERKEWEVIKVWEL
jgi:hypothetical protein